MRNKTFMLTCTGSGNFPIDMLRYAAGWPMTDLDAERIHRTIELPNYRKGVEVAITFNGSMGHALNVSERFDSFGWVAVITELS